MYVLIIREIDRLIIDRDVDFNDNSFPLDLLIDKLMGIIISNKIYIRYGTFLTSINRTYIQMLVESYKIHLNYQSLEKEEEEIYSKYTLKKEED